jgi:glutamyl-tRNA synthetase
MMTPDPIIGRLAPSPTGGLHLGHARTFLLAWLAARARGGRVVLRIEDIDASRVRHGMAEAALLDLAWLGLDWDEGPDVGGPSRPYLQSQRSALHAAALERLRRQEQVFPCSCTRSDIARMASAPHAGEGEPVYPGTCRTRSAADAERLHAAGKPFAWRFRVETGPVPWDDEALGPTALDPSQAGGDFLVARASGEPSYQLAVVVDDATMGITHVLRGDDLVTSTPRQLLLYQALGHAPPKFAHVPLVLDSQGRRLAKRDQALKLSNLREAGVDARRVVGWLAHSCGWTPEGTRSRPVDLLARGPLDLPREPWNVPARLSADCPEALP